MLWFGRKNTVVPMISTSVGIFTFDSPGWIARACERDLDLICTTSDFDVRSVDEIQKILNDIDSLKKDALLFATEHGHDVWDGKGTLVLESIDVTDIITGVFGLTFGVDEDPDFTITVEYEHGAPHVVWGAD